MEPLVSVIMPCYNGEKYIEAAIQSIQNQSMQEWELIIVDDCSEDRSPEIIEKLASNERRIKHFKNSKNRGVFYSRNYGIENSSGRYIALMDADDIAYSDRLEMQIEYLENHSDVGAVSGYYDYLDMENNLIINKSQMRFLNGDEVKVQLLFELVIAEGSTTFRKKVLESNCIRFPEEYPAVGGYKFWCDFARVAKINVLPQKSYQYRINVNGLTQVTKREKKELRFKWHDTIHLEYWKNCGLSIENIDRTAILKATRGEHLENVREVCEANKAIRIMQKQLTKNSFAHKVTIDSVCAYERKSIWKKYFWETISKMRKRIK